ncbi:MAG: macro domain-containing protein [Zoogloeaceae bacterium]|jgi:O-acetyl-ADP-ribose deacetylase (regulator of RNase III)|nr:macro domain-containing protein [Zoogloeaceae bacterium]
MEETKIRVTEGDLLDQPVEAIVNAWNRNVIPWWLLLPQGVSGAIKRKGGTEPFRELARHGAIPLGGAVHTTAGRLPFQGIIHVAGINLLWFATEKSIRLSTRSALELAAQKGYRSIAFPLIGAGTGGASRQKTLDLIRVEAEASGFSGEVVIVDYAPGTTPSRAAVKAKKISPAVIAAALFVLLHSQPMMGFMAILFSLPVAIWMIFQIVHAVGHPGNGKTCAFRVGVWCLAFALAYGINVFRDNILRQRADVIVAKIEAYQAQHGTCPPTLEAIGESRERLSAALGLLGFYGCKENNPHFAYPVPYVIYDMYFYDFEGKTWIRSPMRYVSD